MNPERWREVDELFQRVADLPEAERQQLLVDAAPEIRGEVLALLACDDGGTVSDWHDLVRQGAASATRAAAFSWIGRRLGPWRVTGTLGQGGMGTVLEAERDDAQYAQRVAIKLVKREMDSDFARRRFVQERQILASLEHPNIARLMDGGATEDGLPYLVMEYIEGEPIVSYAERRKLSIEERLKLFRQALGAVAFAHQKLIVHRDLKPSNIMITADGTARLLDFGIARLCEADPVEGAETATALRMMTPGYASPEQVRGEPAAPASDIYSMGAVLYELLTGRSPHALTSQSVAEIAEVVCRRPVKPPSEAAPKLRRKLAGDLDTIALTALQKDAARRYESAAAMAEDLRRYLEGLPIRARADSVLYRGGKFLRRNPFSAAAGAAAVVALCAGIVTTSAAARRAERRLRDVQDLANSFIFDVDAQLTGSGGPTAARRQIVSTALSYLERLAADGESDPTLRTNLAAAYSKIGDVQRVSLRRVEEARASYAKAIAIGERLSKTPGLVRALAGAYAGTAYIERSHRSMDAAMANTRKAIAVVEESKLDDAEAQAIAIRAWHQIGLSHVDMGTARQALEAFRRGIRLAEEEQARRPSDALLEAQVLLRHGAAGALKNRGELAASVAEARSAAELAFSRKDPPIGTVFSGIRALTGPHLNAPGPIDLALQMVAVEDWKRAYGLTEKLYAADPGNVDVSNAMFLASVTMALAQGKDLEATLRYFRQGARIAEENSASDPASEMYRSNVGNSRVAQGVVLVIAGDDRRALPALESAVELLTGMRATSMASEVYGIEALLQLGKLETRMGRLERARPRIEQALKRALAMWPAALEDLRSYAYIGMSYEGLGDLERASGNRAAACEAYRQSAATWEAWGKEGTSSYYDRGHLGRVGEKLGACR